VLGRLAGRALIVRIGRRHAAGRYDVRARARACGRQVQSAVTAAHHAGGEVAAVCPAES